jgi:selenocysteine lyase/cysteine desulfurase
MESHFNHFRDNIVGVNKEFETPYGIKKLIYADWTASGRLYAPIEQRMLETGELLGNTHSPTTITGRTMTILYDSAKNVIKNHVNAGNSYALIPAGSGMTGAVNKFQRILGLKLHEHFKNMITIPENDKPVVFITHMEHHSNQTSWLETICDVVIIDPDDSGNVNLTHFAELLETYKERKLKIASVTACSNVTGAKSPYKAIAKMIHREGGFCFVDFACSAPYVQIDMRPDDNEEKLDAIFFSPHKFLGGPGTSGILIFDKELYHNSIPDNPGGGTVAWTNPWGEHMYHDDIESREDGGTPPFMQVIKTAMCVRLKENMNVSKILEREKEIIKYIFERFDKLVNVHLLADNIRDRLGVFSFYIDGLHHDLGVKMFNDRFGIQMRSGCSCAGTYGHYLLHINRERSKEIIQKINNRNYFIKPGWIRMSIHPSMTNAEITEIMDAIELMSNNFNEWSKDYEYNQDQNMFVHRTNEISNREYIESLLNI